MSSYLFLLKKSMKRMRFLKIFTDKVNELE